MSEQKPTPLDVALAGLKATVEKLPPKTQSIIVDWIVKWNRYIRLESTFKPDYVPRFKRGDIVYVDFGFNVGAEYGGVHYAAVLEVDNKKTNGNIIVIPLTSLEIGKTAGDISRADLYLGEDVIDWTSSATVAKPTQIRAISKMRIIKPLKKGDNRARLTPEHLDLIDSRVKQSIMKNSPVDKKTIDKTETV